MSAVCATFRRGCGRKRRKVKEVMKREYCARNKKRMGVEKKSRLKREFLHVRTKGRNSSRDETRDKNTMVARRR